MRDADDAFRLPMPGALRWPILKTHDIAFCEALADEIYLLNNGMAHNLKKIVSYEKGQNLSKAIVDALQEAK